MNPYDEDAEDFPLCTYPCRGCGGQTRSMSKRTWTCRNCGAGGEVSFDLILSLEDRENLLTTSANCGKVKT